MQYSTITSLHSPHIEGMKALIGSRGKKLRTAQKEFVIEGAQSVKEALTDTFENAPFIKNLYLTESGMARIAHELDAADLSEIKVFLISDEMATELADAQSTQGIFALCGYKEWNLHRLFNVNPKRIAYLWECQDPGNAGTVIRAAAASGFDAVVFSPNSVDIFSPKVLRSTTGSLWHIPVLQDIDLTELLASCEERNFVSVALDGVASKNLEDFRSENLDKPVMAIFGNEARGLPAEAFSGERISIEMNPQVESYNLATAAAIVLYRLRK